MSALPVIAAAPVTLRHIKKGTAAGAVTVTGATFVPQPRKGVAGRRGYSTGSYESALNEEGKGTLVLPNTVGDDGILHRRRFLCLTDPGYHVGDEWIEIWQDGSATPLFVGSPSDSTKRRANITLELVDALWMLNTQRETAAGFWAHAPRDVFEHYTKAWVPVVSDDFDNGAAAQKWTKAVNLGTVTDQVGSVELLGAGSMITARDDWWGSLGLASERAWRLEMTYSRDLVTNQGVRMELVDLSDPTVLRRIGMLVDTRYTQVDTKSDDHVTAGFDISPVTAPNAPKKANATLAIEVRDRWVLFYVDGALHETRELDITTDTGAQVVPRIFIIGGAALGGAQIHSILLRKLDPYLMRSADHGDYRLPGLRPSGGLRGTYYDEADLRAVGDTSLKFYRRALAPTRQPYARQQDATINFPTSNPLTWQPATPPNGEYFTVRWTGAIYLDLAAQDVTLRLTQLDNAARLWVGKTMYADQVIDQWVNPTGAPFTRTTGSMRTHLGASVSGWYPIRIEFAQGAAPGGIVFQRSVGGAAYEVVPAAALSPYGIYEAEVRYDSHAEQLKAIALAYALQYRCEPRSLESGQFPGEVVPRVRVGRDTDKVLTPDESTDVAVSGSAAEVVDTLLADASGLGDQANAAQLTSEAIHYAGVQPGQHMMIASAYESLSDITDPALLQTRLAAMLGLRVTTWEEVSARPRGHRELRHSYPPIALPADLAIFHWEPGDGLRIEDEAIDLRDETPRQIIAPSWPFTPDGLGAPAVRFRQRPRSQQDAMRALVRATLLPQRNYQGQLVTVNGTWSNTDSGYTRVALPRDLDDVVRCELVVGIKTDASTWTVTDPVATPLATFATTGRINLMHALKRRTDSTLGSVGQMFIVQGVAGTGIAEYALELLVRV